MQFRHFMINLLSGHRDQKNSNMFGIAIFTVLLSVYGTHGGPTAAPIVGGQDADVNEYPWQIRLEYDGDFYCGGSIINNKTVLTAAHCVIDDPKQKWGQFSIVAGDHDLSSNEGTEQTIDVDKVIMHKKYDDFELTNDIAILQLVSELDTSGPSVSPVPALASKKFDKKAYDLENCAVSGWGRNSDSKTSSFPDILQELAPTDVVDNKVCKKALKKFGYKIPNSQICAIDSDSGVCNGDSGGPMGCYAENGDFTQVGVVSWGPDNKCANGIQVYTRVSKYAKWIAKNSA